MARPLSPDLPHLSWTVDVRRRVGSLVFLMGWLAAMVVILDVWLHHAGLIASEDLRGLFDAASERGLGSWVSVTQTGLIALTLWGLAAVSRQAGAARWRWAGWTALAVFFSYLAVDDATHLHERVGTAFAESDASAGGLGRFPSYYWQVVLGPAFVAAGMGMVAFLWVELRTRRHKLLVVGACALMGSAVGLDFVDGLGADHPWNLYAHLAPPGEPNPWAAVWFGMDGYDAVVHLSRVLEESLEIVAMTMLWAAFLLHAGAALGGIRLRFSAPAPAEAAVPAGPRGLPHRARRTGRARRALRRTRPHPHGTDRPDA